MKCAYCGKIGSKVIDSRLSEDGFSIRRRRECMSCGRRYTTYEKIETAPVRVIKNSGNRQQFNPAKIKNGIMKACEKRPVSIEQIDRLVSDVERKVNNSSDQEITSKQIGEWVMEGLKGLDEVSYIRFASVHREFKDINTLLEVIKGLIKDKK